MSSQRNLKSAAAQAKYRYKPRGYFPKQTKWLNLTISLFNADVADVLLSEAEKNLVIVDLSRAFTQSETLGSSGDIYHNRTVRVVKQMFKGDVVIVGWQVCAATLTHQLQIPEHWFENPTFRPMPRPEDTFQTRAVHQNEPRKRKKPEASTPSTLASGSTASEGQSSASQHTRQNKRRVESDASTATLQGHVEVIEINSDDEDVKPAIKRQRKDAHHGRQENTGSDGNNNIGQINAAEAQHEVERQISTETNAANMQKTITELRKIMQFLPNIAASESKTFRKGILSPFITKIQSHGWNDLVRWADQLVVAKGRDFRQFVAEELRETLAARVKDLSA
ncbi:hypothetical protein K4K56_002574 [Colletotrichum sp. SAR 10_98]|nr:hypothetical protein K4K56_002574 [Colletotrichum sp. SAR 10_98]